MQNTIHELIDIVDAYAKKFGAIPDSEFSKKPRADKWSKKEVLGHLIDSAQNNLRRFVISQYEASPPKITYEQEFWVNASGYQDASQEDIIQLWKLLNHQIGRILRNMPPANYSQESDTGRQSPNLHRLDWLAADYVKHMKHHINQIMAGSFDVVYP